MNINYKVKQELEEKGIKTTNLIYEMSRINTIMSRIENEVIREIKSELKVSSYDLKGTPTWDKTPQKITRLKDGVLIGSGETYYSSCGGEGWDRWSVKVPLTYFQKDDEEIQRMHRIWTRRALLMTKQMKQREVKFNDLIPKIEPEYN